MAQAQSSPALPDAGETAGILPLLESAFHIRARYRNSKLWTAEAEHRIAGLEQILDKSADKRTGESLCGANVESALERELRLVSFFFHLATLLRRNEALKGLLGGLVGSVLNDADDRKLGPLAAALFLDQDCAARIALYFREALPFELAFSRELDCVLKSRASRGAETSAAGDVPEERVKSAQLLGLAFSGGGIRSATLNLGLLQALAELKLLRYVDYLSTVSGGGYIGSWLHAWIRQEESLDSVQASLSPKDSPDPDSMATHPIKWLRQYSNYLSPRLGFLSADTWTIVSVWLRNTLLNLLVLVPLFCGALLLPRAFAIHGDYRFLGAAASILALVFAWLLIRLHLRPAKAPGDAVRGPASRFSRWLRSPLGIRLGICGFLFLSAMATAMWFGDPAGPFGSATRSTRIAGGVQASVFGVLLFLLSKEYRSPTGAAIGIGARLLGSVVPSLAGAGLLVGSISVFRPTASLEWPWHLAALGVPAVVLVYFVIIVLHLGLLGRLLHDATREWWSRLSALLTVAMFLWVGLFSAAIYGPLLLAWLADSAYGWYAASGLGAGWIVTTIGGVLTARSSATSGKTGSFPEILAKVAPGVFVAGLVLLLSLGIHLAILQMPSSCCGARLADVRTAQSTEFKVSRQTGGGIEIRVADAAKRETVPLDCSNGCGIPSARQLRLFHFQMLQWPAWWPLVAAAICWGLAILVALRVDVNEFSIHHLYRNRLVRCYLGGPNRGRAPDPFTGFDPSDDFPIASLLGRNGRYAGPYPIVNTALNLVKGEQLAWQERKAESFVFTPLFSGFAATPTEETRAAQGKAQADHKLCLHGYRPTRLYAFGPKGVNMGTAVAISGAAASPNMGFHTSPAAAFLLTVFNVRLGWWIGNPRRSDAWLLSGPKFGLLALLRELTASTDNRSRFLYLSDGGHFENLGIYELVRRRCQYIIASDGGCDPAFSFEDLGNAIRKCRSDFGVEIEIDAGDIRPASGVTRSKAHCAVGTIKYPEGTWGTLVYIKASLTGDEPVDVLEYASMHPEFPHQSTGDQFFDESQFESYRKLGYHIGSSAFREIVARRNADFERRANGVKGPIGNDPDRFFSDLREYWYASSPKVAASFTRHAETLTTLMKELREDPDLAFMDEQFSPEWSRLMQGRKPPLSSGLGLPNKYQERRAGFHFCNSLMQLMENVYLDLNLEDEFAHPDNAGWINLFKHWSWSSMFRVNWAISAGCYGSRFRNFCRHRLGLGADMIGKVTADPARDQDPNVNFREREILSAGLLRPGDRLLLLQIAVKRPDPPPEDGHRHPEECLIRLTFGIALVDQHNNLVYFRVQDHLRRMGLARRAMEAMVQQGSFERIEWREPPRPAPEPVDEENMIRVERIWQALRPRQAADRQASAAVAP